MTLWHGWRRRLRAVGLLARRRLPLGRPLRQALAPCLEGAQVPQELGAVERIPDAHGIPQVIVRQPHEHWPIDFFPPEGCPGAQPQQPVHKVPDVIG